MTQKANTATVDDPTTGEDPILGQELSVEINGTTYPLRRLGVRDTFALARIIGRGAGATGISSDAGPDELIGLLLAGLGASEGEAIRLLASVIGVSPADFENPELFPMGSEVDIIAALAQHQDLRAFFGKLGELMAKRPEFQTRTA